MTYTNFKSNLSGYQKTIDTLTYIDSKIIEQKFYTIPNLPDFVSIEEGRGGVAETVLNWATFDVAGSFESGNFGSNADFERTASVDVAINDRTFYRQKWKKSVTYNIMDMEQANQAKIINIVEGKLKARKKHWDLGIQETMFLGSKENVDITGLLNNNEVNVNLTAITKPLSEMTADEFNAFIGSLPNLFFANSNRTAMFNTFVLPASDYLGLTTQMSAQFPLKSKLEVLEDAWSKAVASFGVRDFKILPVAYAEAEQAPSGKATYVLYNRSNDTLVYDLALDYTTTAFGTYNNFDFMNIAYGMYGGVNILRPAEVMYFQINA